MVYERSAKQILLWLFQKSTFLPLTNLQKFDAKNFCFSVNLQKFNFTYFIASQKFQMLGMRSRSLKPSRKRVSRTKCGMSFMWTQRSPRVSLSFQEDRRIKPAPRQEDSARRHQSVCHTFCRHHFKSS